MQQTTVHVNSTSLFAHPTSLLANPTSNVGVPTSSPVVSTHLLVVPTSHLANPSDFFSGPNSPQNTTLLLVTVVMTFIAGISLLMLLATLLTVAILYYKHWRKKALIPKKTEETQHHAHDQHSSQEFYHMLNHTPSSSQFNHIQVEGYHKLSHSPNHHMIIPQGYSTFQPGSCSMSECPRGNFHIYDDPEKLTENSKTNRTKDSYSDLELSQTTYNADEDAGRPCPEQHPLYKNELLSSSFLLSETGSNLINETLSSDTSYKELNCFRLPEDDRNMVQRRIPSFMISSSQLPDETSEQNGHADGYTVESHDKEHNLTYLSTSSTHTHIPKMDFIPPTSTPFSKQTGDQTETTIHM